MTQTHDMILFPPRAFESTPIDLPTRVDNMNIFSTIINIFYQKKKPIINIFHRKVFGFKTPKNSRKIFEIMMNVYVRSRSKKRVEIKMKKLINILKVRHLTPLKIL